MAITNAQQYKQLVNPPMKGNKRPGYRGDAAYGDRTDKNAIGDGRAKSGSTNNQVDTGDFGSEEANVKQNIAATLGGSGKSNPIESVDNLRRFLNTRPTVRRLPPIGPFGIATNLFNKQFQKFSDFTTEKNRNFFQKVIGAGKLNLGGKTIDLETVGQMNEEELEDAYQDYMSARLNNEIDAYGNPISRGDGEGSNILLPQGIMAQASATTPEVKEEDEIINYRLMSKGGRAGLAGGGMPYEGGIMDLESSRQMYGLGKLVKKITRSVKKIAKSPVGKAAIGAALFKFGGGSGVMKSLFGVKARNQALLGKEGFLGSLGLTKGFGSYMPTALGGIAASTLGSYFLTPKEEDEDEEFYKGADIDDPRFIMANYEKYINPRLAADGGLMRTGYQEGSKEPVAKKVMPLLDMDGKEKDYRETGGFVDMGRMEKADDVPARLSKNEFVFTADAVRNAGDGSVDKGAEVMYNMMKNLESGGDVSEDSQGLEGAREMFKTSQRLEEVL